MFRVIEEIWIMKITLNWLSELVLGIYPEYLQCNPSAYADFVSLC